MNNSKAIEISENIFWVGAVDWSMRNFHGYETSRGSTYNAYLILDEKITLIDTAKVTFTDELLRARADSNCRLKSRRAGSFRCVEKNCGTCSERRNHHDESKRLERFDGALRQIELQTCQSRRLNFNRQTHAEIRSDSDVALARFDGDVLSRRKDFVFKRRVRSTFGNVNEIRRRERFGNDFARGEEVLREYFNAVRQTGADCVKSSRRLGN